eukprot:GEMP01060814.1.p1 GENE.GEMP01060814.1~~GEMP01060814.1.p1  ORF type:complete len:197 (+),score=43.54 GEMP01060814.1:70-660(+)
MVAEEIDVDVGLFPFSCPPKGMVGSVGSWVPATSVLSEAIFLPKASWFSGILNGLDVKVSDPPSLIEFRCADADCAAHVVTKALLLAMRLASIFGLHTQCLLPNERECVAILCVDEIPLGPDAFSQVPQLPTDETEAFVDALVDALDVIQAGASEEDGTIRKLDPTDNGLYSLKEFIAEYGGSPGHPPREWLAAAI